MDCSKVGKLIFSLRKEKGLTQKELAEAMNISNKTVSKWERGLGCPDVSLLPALSALLDVKAEKLLQGELAASAKESGNMRNIHFYLCPICGSIETGLGNSEVFCCGRKLTPLAPKESDASHKLTVEESDGELFLTVPHEMTKEHYLTFIAFVGSERLFLVKLYPEQNAQVRIPLFRRGVFYVGCSRHGLYKSKFSLNA